MDGDVLHGKGGEEELAGGVVVLKPLAGAPVVVALYGDVVVVAVPVPDALDEEAHEGEGVLPGDGLELVPHPQEGVGEAVLGAPVQAPDREGVGAAADGVVAPVDGAVLGRDHDHVVLPAVLAHGDGVHGLRVALPGQGAGAG